jgi:hypothetical protein
VALLHKRRSSYAHVPRASPSPPRPPAPLSLRSSRRMLGSACSREPSAAEMGWRDVRPIAAWTPREAFRRSLDALLAAPARRIGFGLIASYFSVLNWIEKKEPGKKHGEGWAGICERGAGGGERRLWPAPPARANASRRGCADQSTGLCGVGISAGSRSHGIRMAFL